MESATGTVGGWWLFAVPMLKKQGRSSLAEAYTNLNGVVILVVLGVISACALLVCWVRPGGPAWGSLKGKLTIPGPRGYPVIGSLMEMGALAHRRLAELEIIRKATSLMALSFGETRVVIASEPETLREILQSSAFADRPLKQSAQHLLFGRAIGFAPYGDYWSSLRRIAANYLFAPRWIVAHEKARLAEVEVMLDAIERDVKATGWVQVRQHLQRASLKNIMSSVFGRRYDFASGSEEADQLGAMVKEGFELLGAFNWADHLPALKCFDAQNIHQRCAALVPRVSASVQKIIDEHRERREAHAGESYDTDSVDVSLGLSGDEKHEDMIAMLWGALKDPLGESIIAISLVVVTVTVCLYTCIPAKKQVIILCIIGSLMNGAQASDLDEGRKQDSTDWEAQNYAKIAITLVAVLIGVAGVARFMCNRRRPLQVVAPAGEVFYLPSVLTSSCGNISVRLLQDFMLYVLK
ncbi:hypothetical protein KC19_12G097300 [Ceratodon purpureus]|uniref:Cytochrome P450 n=1 Tax=Ceratodon purpureus TaxID=3225 RepID=A0A8T0G639_CERPU|nr:hypothetical protein KC19_12G097300 [Ceratodon purpureus]